VGVTAPGYARGTDGSNPPPSSGESANSRSSGPIAPLKRSGADNHRTHNSVPGLWHQSGRSKTRSCRRAQWARSGGNTPCWRFWRHPTGRIPGRCGAAGRMRLRRGSFVSIDYALPLGGGSGRCRQ
jgi:hypothetical protein